MNFNILYSNNYNMEGEFLYVKNEGEIGVNANKLKNEQSFFLSEIMSKENSESIRNIYRQDLENFNSLINTVLSKVNKINREGNGNIEQISLLVETYNGLINEFLNNSRSYSEIISDLSSIGNTLAKSLKKVAGGPRENVFDKIYNRERKLREALNM